MAPRGTVVSLGRSKEKKNVKPVLSRVMKPKRNLFQYSPSKMKKALEAVRHENMKVQTASKLFNVPRTSLRDRLSGKTAEDSYGTVGRSPCLGDIESEIVEWVIDIAARGAPIRKIDLITSISMIVKERNIPNPFTNDIPGEKWYQLFMKRHSTISLKRSEYLSKCRANVDEGYIRLWFSHVRQLLGSDVTIFDDPKRVFNADETAVYVCPAGGLVLGEKGKPLYKVGTRSKENLTILICGNASGELAPPCAVFPFERTPSRVKQTKPKGWHYSKTEKGWMTGVAFLDYVKNAFYPWLLDKNVQLPVILVIDGHVSHLTLSLSRFCREIGIILVLLPPNTTSILQPLDVSFFFPLKCGWKSILREWKRQQKFEVDVQIHHIPSVMNELLKNETFVKDLINGFRACSLVPFDVDRFPYEKLIKKKSCVNDTALVKAVPQKQVCHLEQLEQTIPRSVLSSFLDQYTVDQYGPWNGIEYYGGLYDIWVAYKKSAESITNEQCSMQSGNNSPCVPCVNNQSTVSSPKNIAEPNDSLYVQVADDGAVCTLDLDAQISLENLCTGTIRGMDEQICFESACMSQDVAVLCEEVSVSPPPNETQICSKPPTCSKVLDSGYAAIQIYSEPPKCSRVLESQNAAIESKPPTCSKVLDWSQRAEGISVTERLEAEYGSKEKKPTATIQKRKKTPFIPVVTDISWIDQKEALELEKQKKIEEMAEKKRLRELAVASRKKEKEEEAARKLVLKRQREEEKRKKDEEKVRRQEDRKRKQEAAEQKKMEKASLKKKIFPPLLPAELRDIPCSICELTESMSNSKVTTDGDGTFCDYCRELMFNRG